MSQNSYILPKVMLALRDSLIAKAFSWTSTAGVTAAPTIEAGMQRGDLDDDGNIAPNSTPLPNIVTKASQARNISPHDATFNIQCEVTVNHSADDTSELDHMEQAGQVSDFLYDEATLLTALNVYPLFTAQDIRHSGQRFEIDGRLWKSTFEFEISACGSTLA